jgi:hypothetical protein
MDAGGELEKVEDLLLELRELGVENLHDLSFAHKAVTLGVEDLQDSRSARGRAVAQLGVANCRGKLVTVSRPGMTGTGS